MHLVSPCVHWWQWWAGASTAGACPQGASQRHPRSNSWSFLPNLLSISRALFSYLAVLWPSFPTFRRLSSPAPLLLVQHPFLSVSWSYAPVISHLDGCILSPHLPSTLAGATLHKAAASVIKQCVVVTVFISPHWHWGNAWIQHKLWPSILGFATLSHPTVVSLSILSYLPPLYP